MNPSYQKRYLKINDKTLLHDFYKTQTFFEHGTKQYNSATKLGILSRDGTGDKKW